MYSNFPEFQIFDSPSNRKRRQKTQATFETKRSTTFCEVKKLSMFLLFFWMMKGGRKLKLKIGKFFSAKRNEDFFWCDWRLNGLKQRPISSVWTLKSRSHQRYEEKVLFCSLKNPLKFHFSFLTRKLNFPLFAFSFPFRLLLCARCHPTSPIFFSRLKPLHYILCWASGLVVKD